MCKLRRVALSPRRAAPRRGIDKSWYGDGSGRGAEFWYATAEPERAAHHRRGNDQRGAPGVLPRVAGVVTPSPSVNLIPAVPPVPTVLPVAGAPMPMPARELCPRTGAISDW